MKTTTPHPVTTITSEHCPVSESVVANHWIRAIFGYTKLCFKKKTSTFGYVCLNIIYMCMREVFHLIFQHMTS